MISIVTPSYGQLEWLRLCIASVADQSGVEIEHIIQDAGTEGISELEAEHAVRNPKDALRIFVEQDAGMYDAINRGLRRATGEVCAYLNCDEQYLPGTLSRVAKFFADRPDIDVLFGDVVLVDETGRPLSYRRTILPAAQHIRLSHLNTATCATFFRRTLITRGFFFDPSWKTIGDAVWIERLLQERIPLATWPEPLATFTFTGQNLGATELSREEGRAWKGADRAVRRLARMRAVLRHRLRKAWAGAYRRRNVDIEIYTRASPERRQRMIAEKVGFSWPS